MKIGQEIKVSLIDMVTPMIGRLVELPDDNFQARIMSFDETGAVLRVVPASVKE